MTETKPTEFLTAPTTVTGAVSITDQTRTYRVLIANAISHRGRVWADFDTAEEAFSHARESRFEFNNTRVELFKIVGHRVVVERVYQTRWMGETGTPVEVTRPLVAHLEINDLTTVDDVIGLS